MKKEPKKDLLSSAPIHIIDGEYIKEWLVLGPFFPDDLETDFLADVGGEANIDPQEGDTVTLSFGRNSVLSGRPRPRSASKTKAEGRTLTWKRYQSKTEVIDLVAAVGFHTNATAYAFCYLKSETASGAPVYLSADDGISVWVNGQWTYSNPARGPFMFDSDLFEADLNAGINRCLIKVSQWNHDWAFAVQVLPPTCAVVSGRITDAAGKPVPHAELYMEQDGLEIASAKTDTAGNYRIGVFPVCGSYDLAAVHEKQGAWRLGIQLNEGERKTLNLILKESISIEGMLLMPDNKTRHVAVPVQAVRISESAHEPMGELTSSRSTLPVAKCADEDACSADACSSDEAVVQVSRTTLSDEGGRYQFINLKDATGCDAKFLMGMPIMGKCAKPSRASGPENRGGQRC